MTYFVVFSPPQDNRSIRKGRHACLIYAFEFVSRLLVIFPIYSIAARIARSGRGVGLAPLLFSFPYLKCISVSKLPEIAISPRITRDGNLASSLRLPATYADPPPSNEALPIVSLSCNARCGDYDYHTRFALHSSVAGPTPPCEAQRSRGLEEE